MHSRFSLFSDNAQVCQPRGPSLSDSLLHVSDGTCRFATSLVIGLLLLVCQQLPSVAQTLPDEEAVRRQAAATPVDQLLKIPPDICGMRLSVEYRWTDRPASQGGGYRPPPREMTFCEYAANLAAGQTGTISEMKLWNVPAYVVPVVGFVVNNVKGPFARDQVACTFKNSGGKLVYVGMWVKDGSTGRIEYSANMPDLAYCLDITHYYDGENARGLKPPPPSQEEVDSWYRAIVAATAGAKIMIPAPAGSGTVELHFTLYRVNGTSKVMITKSSGVPALDQTAILMVRSLPYPMPGVGIPGDEFDFHLTMQFRDPPPPDNPAVTIKLGAPLPPDTPAVTLRLARASPPRPGYPAQLDRSDRPILHPGTQR